MSLLFLALAAVLTTNCSDSEPETPQLAPFDFESRFVEVLGSRMHYVEQGSGAPILLLHGNPSSAFIWRNVIPKLSSQGRVIAPDLIGHGQSDKPNIEYSYRQHVEHLTAFIEALGLQNLTLVVHDAGNIGFSYAAQHPENIRGIIFFETLLGPVQSLDDAPPELRDFFTRLRDPQIGPQLVLEENFFIEQLLQQQTLRTLTEPELNRYRAPFPTPQSRTPLLAWPTGLPVGGEPADAFALWAQFQSFLFTSPIPKLLLHVEPGLLLPPAAVAQIEANMRNVTVRSLGQGLHFVQEDAPDALGDAIADWLPELEASAACAPPPAAVPFEDRFVEVNGSRMHYYDEGEGRPILLLHGNPSSAYLWRNIIPHLSPHGRVIAPDLIGMGSSDKPDIGYTFEDHAAYLDGFITALGIDQELTLVVHDWGSGLGFNWAAEHPDQVRAVAFMEALAAPVVPTSFQDVPPQQAMLFQMLRDPVLGEQLIREQNFFVEQFLPLFTACTLSFEAHEQYRAPFVEPSSRTPVVVWPTQIPIDGEPEAMVARATAWNQWLATSSVPKLALYAEPGLIMPKPAVDAMMQSFPNLQAENVGPGLHYIQESQPDAIGAALADWIQGQ